MIVKILNHNWKILKKSKIEMDEIEANTLGLTIFPNREIWLLDELKEKNMVEQVVTHEIVHVLLDEFACTQIGNYNDEFICDFIANNIKMIKDLSNEIILNAFC